MYNIAATPKPAKPRRRAQTSSKPPKSQNVSDDDPGIVMDMLSLQSLGTYMMFEEVDCDSSRAFCEFLIKANFVFPEEQPVTILLNTPGGSVYDGFGMIDLMECSRIKIQTVAIGVVASMGALLFTAGTPGMRLMTRNSYIMTHQFSNYFEGKYHEFIATRAHEDELHDRFIQHFLRHSKMTEAQIKDVLLGPSDKWISADDAMKYGLCDVVRNPWS